ncbi:DNA polymerase subunit gamma-2, mitochondrial [Trichonephila inaurata madagascariensis]|uniref:DNA polymerase subunit gamma-2, mitochondrial n=1 Tax=Trichonephila inaurata madagascariensis TaxID=2747483 RepID=A0A8X7C212_9ARAC|nr:DNA polymerase subunit gamma-2, mitochondrial [Trichonephila inaurata madagascariensis]
MKNIYSVVRLRKLCFLTGYVMKSPAVASVTFKKLIQCCSKSHILNVQNTSNATSLQYGPLGCLLKKNIFNEWFYSILNDGNVNMFPVEISNPRKQTFLLQSSIKEVSNDLLQNVIDKYFEIHNRLGYDLPFGLVMHEPCINKNISREESPVHMDLNILNNLEAWTRISVIFFCPPKKSINWFHHWSKERHLWWRKVTKTSSDDQHLSLLLEYPWGKEKLETITLHDGKFIHDLCEKYQKQQQINSLNQNSIPAVITCETELDLAVMACLANSYDEDRNLFHLHCKLAPYKISFAVEQNDLELFRKMENVVSHITKELKRIGISVLAESDSNVSVALETKLEKYDEMGIPYVVILNEESLSTGYAGLRNRDSTLQEQILISDIPSLLAEYLEIER